MCVWDKTKKCRFVFDRFDSIVMFVECHRIKVVVNYVSYSVLRGHYCFPSNPVNWFDVIIKNTEYY